MGENKEARVEAYRWVEEGYKNTVLREMEHDPAYSLSPKAHRAAIRAQLEKWRFARNSRKIFEREGFPAMFEFQHNFDWKHDRHWKKYHAWR